MKNQLSKLRATKSYKLSNHPNDKFSKLPCLNSNRFIKNAQQILRSKNMKNISPIRQIPKTRIIINKDRKFNNLKNKRDSKENSMRMANYGNNKQARCVSQEVKRIEIYANKKQKLYEEKEEEDVDVDAFFKKINNEFSDIGKLIELTFEVDEQNKYKFIKNEFVLLKIIENELKNNNGLNIKEFVFNNKKLNLFKSLKGNNLNNNSIIKIILE